MSEDNSTIPYGYCHCGCGEKTGVPKRTNSSVGRFKGVPVRYIRGHSGRGRRGDAPGEKRCIKCGHTKPLAEFYKMKRSSDGRTYECAECIKRRVTQWQKDNPDKKREKHRKWVEENRERLTEYNREYRERNLEALQQRRKEDYERNRERYKERARAYRLEHPEHYRELQKRYREENPEKRRAWIEANRGRIQESARAWRKNNPEKRRLKKIRRRQRERNAEGEITAAELKDMMSSQQGLCAYCEESMGQDFEIEHMVPLSRGGRNDWTNICLSCGDCNRLKNARTAEEFMNHR